MSKELPQNISDKIIMTKNNYSDGYLNGDIGVIKAVEDDTITVVLGDEKELTLKKSNLEDVAPAYALTVHKSQGSEFSTVIVVLPEEPRCMLQKNLLYTAVTRAKKMVVLIGKSTNVYYMIMNKLIVKSALSPIPFNSIFSGNAALPTGSTTTI